MGVILNYCRCDLNQIYSKSNVEIEARNIEIDSMLNNKNDITCTNENIHITNINEENTNVNERKTSLSNGQSNSPNVTTSNINTKTETTSTKKINKKKLLGKKKINFILLGDVEVGKSTFVIKFTENRFEQYYVPSIDKESKRKKIIINKHEFILNFIVIKGGEYDTKKYEKEFSESDFFLLFYDVTNEESFIQIKNNMNKLIKFLKFYEISDNNFSNICLVGNKYDSENVIKFNEDKVREFIDSYKINKYEISTKTAKNINIFITSLVRVIDECAYPLEKDDY